MVSKVVKDQPVFKELMESKEPKDLKEPKELKEIKDQLVFKEPLELKDFKGLEFKDLKELQVIVSVHHLCEVLEQLHKLQT